MRTFMLASLAVFAFGCGDKDGGDDTSAAADDTSASTDDTSATADDTSVAADDTGSSADDTSAGSDTAIVAELYGTVPAKNLPAPTFSEVLDYNNTGVSQSDLIGSPTVMWFYPFANTYG